MIADGTKNDCLELKSIILQKMTSDATESRELIVKEASNYTVLCSTGDLSYAAYTNDYCQVTKGDIVCYAFKN